jgi:hypothetical protein
MQVLYTLELMSIHRYIYYVVPDIDLCEEDPIVECRVGNLYGVLKYEVGENGKPFGDCLDSLWGLDFDTPQEALAAYREYYETQETNKGFK